MTDRTLMERSEQTAPGPNHSEPNVLAPIVVSLGKKTKKQIKRLKQGRGRAMDEVLEAVAQVQANLGERAADKIVVPVVVLYRRKQGRMPRWF